MAIELVHETRSATEDNEQGRVTGWLPGRLSTAGPGAGAAAGQRRANDGIAAVFSSDLTRAAETALWAYPWSGDERLAEDGHAPCACRMDVPAVA